jgi:hypothetical protein
MFKEKREGGKLVWLVGCGCGFAKELLSQRSLRKIREGREEKLGNVPEVRWKRRNSETAR